MLPSIFALALVATPTSASGPASVPARVTATARAGSLLPPRVLLPPALRSLVGPDVSLCTGGLCGARLGVGGHLGLGQVVPALSSSFAQWSVAVPGNARRSLGLGLPPLSDNGLLVARLGYGLFLGKPKTQRPQLFIYYDQEMRLNGVGGSPNSLFRDPRRGLGMDWTLMLNRHVGLQATIRKSSRSWFTGASLVFRP